MRILVTGGVRSGKSTHAEALLANAVEAVCITPGRHADGSDPDWDSRVALHRARRPPTWLTIETADVATALSNTRCPVLVDCLGTWLTALMDGEALWNATSAEAYAAVEQRLDTLCAALTALTDAIVVTNEVGLGVVPAHRSGMLFRDLLGTINQRVANVCDEVHLLIAGRVLKL
ncbi:cobinamide kinase / cobinamide phosphate guanyltransferase family protein [Mycobacterium kansasii 732]|uniref:Adenosylcobinamide kinase n=1 Tax=Mycobacterium pseudokansasii TaxID=2341080 RepID=A0A498QM97_9MYCO|nr:bifunctional adenosylcobinamide kinase/adenosylcobinamide-phosphate guanylyltransferase [Mycobacterium pseudokansasii]EUA14724.1 cobinamide kinase / cobinamide phosphate guanyltransferase family protein [Mycobacterium kansasii 732]KZS64641.1 adenosylcobinamide kinase/adenosylcobinamide phosphate guanyltransferase [Mycobacterium kansasii]MBY0389422.1 bifunctional adenosylcobinamide kinase/adenosylcobinamide-phosphate guanylyltransferase [Mycobacterium pseudokansasii]VAZ90365.1 Bifunctional ad